MNPRKLILILIVFVLGFLTATLGYRYVPQALEHPLTLFAVSGETAPSDFLKEGNIEVYNDRIIIRVANTSLSEYASTGSMRPLFDTGANGIRIVPGSEDEIKVGDIITFEKDAILIVHRVVEVGQDEQGTYFIARGDNNFYSDEKVRFEDIKYKTIGILY